MTSSTPPTRTTLLNSATNFCTSLSQSLPTSQLLTNHFTHTHAHILVHEHGLPKLAPFLGRDFRGADGLLEYFTILSKYLTYKNMRFTEYVVDAEEWKVAVRGEATFTMKLTGLSWDETFTYVLRFDEESRVERYEIWADTGAVWLASMGEL